MMIRSLKSGIADYFIQDHLDGLSYLKQQALDASIIALPIPVSVTPVYFALSKKSPCLGLLPKINEQIELAKADGTLAAIISKYAQSPHESLHRPGMASGHYLSPDEISRN